MEAALLTLELTETVLMLDMKGCIEILDALSEQGIKIAIDDFGTGYSSLAYLNRLPIDTIKLDRSFVVGLNLPVIRATVAMATSLGLGILAEGVEEEHELAALQTQGCHVFQGFLFSRPMTPEEVAAAGSLYSAGWVAIPSQTIEQVVDKCAASPIYEVRDAKLNIINRILSHIMGSIRRYR